MNITGIKVSLELEGGEEVITALSQLLVACRGEVTLVNMPVACCAKGDETEDTPPEQSATGVIQGTEIGSSANGQAAIGAALAEAVIAMAKVPKEVDDDMPPREKDARVQWSADRIKEIVVKYVRECKNYDELLSKCTQHHIMWMYKAMLGVPAAESSNSASGAMLALKMPDEDKSKILKLMDIMHRAKY